MPWIASARGQDWWRADLVRALIATDPSPCTTAICRISSLRGSSPVVSTSTLAMRSSGTSRSQPTSPRSYQSMDVFRHRRSLPSALPALPSHHSASPSLVSREHWSPIRNFHPDVRIIPHRSYSRYSAHALSCHTFSTWHLHEVTHFAAPPHRAGLSIPVKPSDSRQTRTNREPQKVCRPQ